MALSAALAAESYAAVVGTPFGPAFRGKLDDYGFGDLQAVIDLELAAAADLAAGNGADARTKLEDARKLLEEQGPQVPGSDPAEFEPDLLEKVGALTDADAAPEVRADVDKRLRKAAERDAKARDKIEAGKPAELKEAEKQIDKARSDKLKAKAVLETGVVAEGKGKPL